MYEVRVTGLKLPVKVSDERKRKVVMGIRKYVKLIKYGVQGAMEGVWPRFV